MPKEVPAGRYSHLSISNRVQVGQYRRPSRKITAKFVREDHAAHGASLEQQLAAALTEAQANMSLRDANVEGINPGVYLEVESLPGTSLDKLELKSRNIRLAAIHAKLGGGEKAALFLPDSSRSDLEMRISEYKKTAGANKPNASHQRFEPLERIALANLATLWRSAVAIPEGPTWFEIWCYRSLAAYIREVALILGLQRSNEKLSFPDFEVIFLHAAPLEIMKLVWNCSGGVFQVRAGMDNPIIFTRSSPRAQHDWVQTVIDRLVIPNADAPAVTLLDIGVTRAHPLISPFLAAEDTTAYDRDWGSDDHDAFGHGTNMAGTTLYGDLTYAAADAAPIQIEHRLESVKILPPTGANPPNSYGVVTQAAVARVEIAHPERRRAICCAVTSNVQDAAVPSSWSSSIDQICSGTMEGDEGDTALEKPKRLVLLATGNITHHVGDQTQEVLKANPIEDPAQSWNAITTGGFTERTIIADAGYESFDALVEAGARSPFSRTSLAWDQSPAPIKPEVLFEAGNIAINRATMECVEGLESLCTLTTGKDFQTRPLVEFNMTSASVGQAARMAATITAFDSSLWPETVRALIVHAADWRQPMMKALQATSRLSDRINLVRQFGYGVPNLERAISSATNDVAIVAQSEIQPFKRKVKRRQGKQVSASVITNEIHYYRLPWPKSVLEQIYDKTVRLKITLSYFIEPNPGAAGSKYVRTYQSYGLRFDLQRKNETEGNFRARINELEQYDEEDDEQSVTDDASPDTGWILGPKSRSAGSLHCDLWEGSAADLITREYLAIYPIAGWWKTRTSEKRYDDRARYSLVVSLDVRGIPVDVYTPIAVELEPLIEIET